MQIISEYFGEAQYVERSALVRYLDKATYHVEMYDEHGLYKIQKLNGRTLQYAENCAEDWVLGVTQ